MLLESNAKKKKNGFCGKCVKRHEIRPQHTLIHTSPLWGKSITIWRMQHKLFWAFIESMTTSCCYCFFFLHEISNQIDSSHCLESIFRAHHTHKKTHLFMLWLCFFSSSFSFDEHSIPLYSVYNIHNALHTIRSFNGIFVHILDCILRSNETKWKKRKKKNQRIYIYKN